MLPNNFTLSLIFTWCSDANGEDRRRLLPDDVNPIAPELMDPGVLNGEFKRGDVEGKNWYNMKQHDKHYMIVSYNIARATMYDTWCMLM